MDEAWSLASALFAGVLLGGIFFCGLWWTVYQGVSAKRVALWFLGSMLLRTCVVLLGFYFVSGGDWKKLVAALLGFIVARLIVMRLTRLSQQCGQLGQKASHAP